MSRNRTIPGTISRTISQALSPFVDLIYPPRCPLCGDAIAVQSGLCTPCWSTLTIPGQPCCAKCQRPFGEDGPAHGLVCAVCLSAPPKHDGIAAGALYNDAARQLVLSFKHGRKIALAPMLARLIAARIGELEGEWLAVPVPLHRMRLWQRGFNQSALLARELTRLTSAHLLVDGLLRRKRTPPLGGLGKKARAKALSGAITINPSRADRIRGAQILLVDDVLTSGATSSACVKALKQGGAAKVRIACFARVLDEAPRS